jgi:hypothetical protein
LPPEKPHRQKTFVCHRQRNFVNARSYFIACRRCRGLNGEPDIVGRYRPRRQLAHLSNDRYGTTIDYPASFQPQPPPDNDDGRRFESADGADFAVCNGQ